MENLNSETYKISAIASFRFLWKILNIFNYCNKNLKEVESKLRIKNSFFSEDERFGTFYTSGKSAFLAISESEKIPKRKVYRE